MKQIMLRLMNISATVIPVGLGIAGITHAATTAPNSIVNSSNQLADKLFCPIINTMFFVLIGLAVIMVLWAAYLYVVAQEDTEKTNRARRTITYAAVAILVALLAKGFPALIGSIVGGDTSSFATWSCNAGGSSAYPSNPFVNG